MGKTTWDRPVDESAPPPPKIAASPHAVLPPPYGNSDPVLPSNFDVRVRGGKVIYVDHITMTCSFEISITTVLLALRYKEIEDLASSIEAQTGQLVARLSAVEPMLCAVNQKEFLLLFFI